jgi:hypothetical protein
VTFDPVGREDLLNNRINQGRCEKCGSDLPLRIGLVYHDMKCGFCVQYFPLEMVARENLKARFDRYGILAGGYDPDELSESIKPFN